MIIRNKSIVFGTPTLDVRKLKEPDFYITSVNIDCFEHTVSIIYEKGISVNVINLTLEEAQESGFLNPYAITQYFK